MISKNSKVTQCSPSELNSLRSLLLNSNKISRIDQISDMFPRLETLSLNDNRIADLNEIAKLSKLPKLERLYLLNNPITLNPEYRIFVISRLPNLKVLDFQKVKEKERKEGIDKYGAFSFEDQLKFVERLTKKEKIKLLIEKTKGLEQLNRLEILLKSGEVSDEVLTKKLMEFRLI